MDWIVTPILRFSLAAKPHFLFVLTYLEHLLTWSQRGGDVNRYALHQHFSITSLH